MISLTREEVRNVIEGKGAASRPPMCFDFWIYGNIFKKNGMEERAEWLSGYPQDIQTIYLNFPGLTEGPADDPEYRWSGMDHDAMEEKGWDDRILIPEWDSPEAEAFLANFPDAEYPGLIPETERDGRYTLAYWWYELFERHWSLRGMQNALIDFYENPEEVHRLYQKLTDFYVRVIERVCEQEHVDGFFTSDDLGTQHSAFFSVEIFREFFKPYYKQIIDKAHSYGAHFWLHSCGNIEALLPDLIEIGLDVIHPIQKYTMDQKHIAERFGDQICFLAGFEVQQIIPYGTVEEVRREVRRMIDTYARPDGRLMLTMGNGSTEDWKLESLEALYEEAVEYGEKIFAQM